MSLKAGEYRRRPDKNSGTARLHSIQHHYAAMITMVDEWIGKVVAALKRNGQYGNTVILFASDHGEMLGDFGLSCTRGPSVSR
jgi:arylsulfatase A-like enzyme